VIFNQPISGRDSICVRRGNYFRPADNKCLIENTKLKIKTNAEQRNVALELLLIFLQKLKRDIRQPR
jgi:hypothetical protein